jgi:hypothetical protein
MRLPEGGAIGGWAALRLQRGGFFDGLADDGRTLRPVPLMVPPSTSLRSRTGDIVIREHLRREDVVRVHGIACLTAGRAAVDEARRAPDLHAAVVVFDMALVAHLTTRAQLAAQLARRAGARGAPQAARALELADDRSLSPQETRMRLVWVLDAGLPTPLCNWHVYDAQRRFIGMPDLLDPVLGVVGEYDGAGHADAARRSRDATRAEAFRGVGLEHFTVVSVDRDDIAALTAKMRAAVSRARASLAPRTWQLRNPPPPLRIE